MRQLIGRLFPAIAPAGRAARPARTAATPPRRGRRHWLRSRRSLAVMATALVLAGGAAGLYQLSRSGELAVLSARMDAGLVEAGARWGLVVNDIEVVGRGMTTPEAILGALGARRGTPLLAISPAAARAKLEALPWVRSAVVERQLPDTLRISLVERKPFAFWQRQSKLMLIDRDGVVITGDRLDRFPGLVVMVGDDAPKHAGELLDMLASQPEIAGRVVAAIRVGGRRWNLHLDNGIDVQLPEDKPQDAWAQLAELERTSRLLARDVQVVDMRLPDRLVVRVTPEPPKDTPKKGRPAAKNT